MSKKKRKVAPVEPINPSDLFPAAGPLSLQAAQELLADGLEDGRSCPCCGQFSRIYVRKMHATIARGLIRLVRTWERRPGWVHVRELGLTAWGDFAKLMHWGMTIQKEKEKGDKSRTSGLWQPAQKGVRVVHNQEKFWSHIMLYDGRFLGFAGEQITIIDALGEKFDYEEVMGMK